MGEHNRFLPAPLSEDAFGIPGPRAALVRLFPLLLCFLWLVASLISCPKVLLSVVSPETALAAEKKQDTKTKKKKKRRRKRQEKKEKEEDTDEAEEAAPVYVLGAEEEFGHEEFDASLGKTGAIDAVLILDASRSMQRTDPERLRDQGAKLFLRFLSAGDRVAIVQFEQDTKILFPLTAVTPEVLADIDKAIESVSVEGNFTDLWSPIVAAMEILNEEGRTAAEKCVILLSDGKMDPHSSVGTKQELIARLKEIDLPQYAEKEIKLYTLSLSEYADRDLLAEMAQLTSGVHWYAADVNAVHKIFSDLFLTLKKPQVVALEGTGFEVDGTTTEATFYISRKEPDQVLTVIDPRGKRFSNRDFPPGVKWYRGDLFDVITIARPFPGPWGIEGLEDPEGFVTLLTDLKLKVRWPEYNLKVGDTMAFKARLTDKGEVVSSEGMKEITFYSYKIVNNRTGQLILQGALNDTGEEGDEEADDNIYTAKIKIDEEGEYKALISVTGPTFTRQQHISFNVSKGLISLIENPGDEFTGEEGGLQVVVSSRGLQLKRLEVKLVAKKVGEDSASLAYPVHRYETAKGVYDAPVFLLEKGEYQLYAQLSGYDAKTKKRVQAVSETLSYVSEGASEYAGEGEGEVEEIEDWEPEDPEAIARMYGLISLGMSLLWAGGIGFFFYRKADSSGAVSVEERPPYTIPEETEERVNSLREMITSDERREPSEKEVALFAAVRGAIGSAKPKPAKKKEEAEAETEAPGEETQQAEGEPSGEEEAEVTDEVSEEQEEETKEQESDSGDEDEDGEPEEDEEKGE